jgi:polar amino acid transport system substrate-binding protein
LRGASIDLATRVLEDIGVPYEVRYAGPWKRVLGAAQPGQVDLVATLKILPERERYLAFAPTAAFPNPVAVFVDRQRAFIYTSWDDLRGRRGGAALGNRFGADFDRFAETELHLQESGTLDTNFRKLGMGRIDYFLVGLYAGEAYLATHGLGGRYMALRPFATEDKNYFGFSRNSPCIKYLEPFEARLRVLVKSGANVAILNANLQRTGILLDGASLTHK